VPATDELRHDLRNDSHTPLAGDYLTWNSYLH